MKVGGGALAVAAAMALAAASLLLIAPAPSYDPWTWLLWGREVSEGTLDTREGPALKPLPVVVCALLAPLGDAAPWLWVLIVRAAALVAIWLAFRLGRELAGGSRTAGVLTALAVATCGQLLALTASGAETALLLALALGTAEAWRAAAKPSAGASRGGLGLAIACAAACGLLRVEAWPFLAVAGFVLWRRRPSLRPLLAVLGVAIPAAWFVPELIGSGDPLRSGERARVPNPGDPAEAAVPALASLGQAVALPLWPLWIGVFALALAGARRALLPAVVGGAWALLVAVMAQLGFSGEARYALPGIALVAVSGAVGLARLPRPAAVAAAVLAAIALAPRLDEPGQVRAAQASAWRLAGDLEDAVAAAGGRERVLACGRPYTGRLRGPLTAYRLGVHRRLVEPDARPRPPGVVFRSALREGEPPLPVAGPPFAEVAREGRWTVLTACRS